MENLSGTAVVKAAQHHNKDNAESDRQAGRECSRGTALHFFSLETKEQMMKVFYHLIFVLSLSGWQSDAMIILMVF